MASNSTVTVSCYQLDRELATMLTRHRILRMARRAGKQALRANELFDLTLEIMDKKMELTAARALARERNV